MSNSRLLFEKCGKAKYISHLDLMRTMQRVFLRAGIRLRHTEGFNPHPYMSFALPLPVGCESVCELLDFDILGDVPLEAVPKLINGFMPEGIAAKKCYVPKRKFSDIRWIYISGDLFYDNGVPENALPALRDFFSRKSIVIPKKTKRALTDVDIIPLINSIEITAGFSDKLQIKAMIAAQNPSLNPDYLIGAIKRNLELSPDFVSFRRERLFDAGIKAFE